MLLSLRSGVPSRSNSRHRQSMARLLPGWGIIPYPDKEGKAGFSGRRSGSGHRCAGSSFSSVSCAVCAAMQERLSPPAPAGDKANRSPARALPLALFDRCAGCASYCGQNRSPAQAGPVLGGERSGIRQAAALAGAAKHSRDFRRGRARCSRPARFSCLGSYSFTQGMQKARPMVWSFVCERAPERTPKHKKTKSTPLKNSSSRNSSLSFIWFFL